MISTEANGKAKAPSGERARRVTVIIVNWNQPGLTQTAIDSIYAQDPGMDISIIVVDNNSTDGSAAQLAANNPHIKVIRRSENGGFGAGVNSGLAASDSELVVLLNNDAVAKPGFVQSLVDKFDAAEGRVAAVTGRILLNGTWTRVPPNADAAAPQRKLVAADGTTWARSETGQVLTNSTGNTIDRSGNGLDREWLAPHPAVAASEVFGFSGGAALLRRSALNEVGLFDEWLFMYYEDTELSWRLRRAGWRILFADDAVAVHQHAGSSGVQSELFIHYNTRNRLAVALLHGSLWMLCSALLHTFWRAIRLRIQSRRSRAAHAELRAAVRGLQDFMKDIPRLLSRRRALAASAVVSRRQILRSLKNWQ